MTTIPTLPDTFPPFFDADGDVSDEAGPVAQAVLDAAAHILADQYGLAIDRAVDEVHEDPYTGLPYIIGESRTGNIIIAGDDEAWVEAWEETGWDQAEYYGWSWNLIHPDDEVNTAIGDSACDGYTASQDDTPQDVAETIAELIAHHAQHHLNLT